MIRISKGLDIPISGAPRLEVEAGPQVRRVALLGADFHDMKPALRVAVGDRVALGQPLFVDKQHPEIHYTAPASGKVVAINRGERRAFLSLVIEVSGSDEETFPIVSIDHLGRLPSEEIEGRLLVSGLWTALRTRPYSKVPAPKSSPAAIFVTAIDTNPLAADPAIAIGERQREFAAGLMVLRRLTEGAVHLCKGAGSLAEVPEGVTVREFGGPHPAGLPGTHIHFLERVDQARTVWYVGYQDVIAIGHLFMSGRILSERIIALGGASVKNPRLIRARVGACLSELVTDELREGPNRVISGSVLGGRRATAENDFLGRYHNQVSVIPEGGGREFLGWIMPGLGRFSLKRTFVSSFLPRRPLAMTTDAHGSLRAMVPIGSFEKVIPLNVKATWLLRSLLTHDTDLAQDLGCLELDEEDLALCSFVCPGKIDYGFHLRQTLRKIEEEG